MRAAVLIGFGGVDQLELRDVPEPTTGPGTIKVQLVATSINPIDWKLPRFPLARIREAQTFAEAGAGGKVIVEYSAS